MAATTEEVTPAPQALSTGLSIGLGAPPSASMHHKQCLRFIVPLLVQWWLINFSLWILPLEWPGLQGEATASGFHEMLEDYEQPSTSAELTGETSTEAELSPGTQSAHTRLMAEKHMEAAGEDTAPSGKEPLGKVRGYGYDI
ncbi:hypothetical protein Efla_002427 [Eimeria flavescens]